MRVDPHPIGVPLPSTACHSAHAPMSTLVSASTRFRSKTITAALAFFLGSLGAHRFYLYGKRDFYGWAHVVGTLMGIPGVLLLIASERVSLPGWVLAFFGTVSVLSAFLAAIVYGLRPDEKWDAQFNAHTEKKSQSGWTVIFIVIFSLLIGAFLLMSALAISFQTYFESQVQAAKDLSQ
jgi:TM2 domain-containing membrane protein YozV